MLFQDQGDLTSSWMSPASSYYFYLAIFSLSLFFVLLDNSNVHDDFVFTGVQGVYITWIWLDPHGTSGQAAGHQPHVADYSFRPPSFLELLHARVLLNHVADTYI